jgi:hypothetical protein
LFHSRQAFEKAMRRKASRSSIIISKAI